MCCGHMLWGLIRCVSRGALDKTNTPKQVQTLHTVVYSVAHNNQRLSVIVVDIVYTHRRTKVDVCVMQDEKSML